MLTLVLSLGQFLCLIKDDEEFIGDFLRITFGIMRTFHIG